MERRRKQEYETPTMQVVELQHSAPLVCTSEGMGARGQYSADDNDPFAQP